MPPKSLATWPLGTALYTSWTKRRSSFKQKETHINQWDFFTHYQCPFGVFKGCVPLWIRKKKIVAVDAALQELRKELITSSWDIHRRIAQIKSQFGTCSMKCVLLYPVMDDYQFPLVPNSNKKDNQNQWGLLRSITTTLRFWKECVIEIRKKSLAVTLIFKNKRKLVKNYLGHPLYDRMILNICTSDIFWPQLCKLIPTLSSKKSPVSDRDGTSKEALGSPKRWHSMAMTG
ncbi:hypothetical protein P5673_005254 [Acropora cervicornis]|uniref:Uncharacterized protein n=1 Tax=Acropora cervicornis TaxID=6130 RepID=A0AAD9VDW4_ACRCE|nr:hypothetical protein P5673_005254 [Acropora cervicornis]